ncbi:MAG TPA: HepT-like ribonuclease domain-containing protein [Chloroflexota bacterium]|nr:HepT-like ribonuclease domain-containing protein [Chloroflexota bacterium]
MTSQERERERLIYIRESITRIEQYTQGGRETFLTEPMVEDAVLRRLETLADATHRLSPATKARHPEIPWQQVYGFRNIAAHAYVGLDLRRVWEIVESYLPPLKDAVDAELGRAD